MISTPPRELIAKFGALIGIPDLTPTEDGSCRLLFDGHHPVTLVIIPALRNLVLTCPCANVNPLNPHTAMVALRANYMGGGSCGGRLCLGPDGKLHLQFQLPLERLEPERIMATIEILLNQVEAWTRRIQAAEDIEMASRVMRDPCRGIYTVPEASGASK